MTSLPLVALLVLNASGAKLASPGLNGVNIKPEEATFYSDHLAHQLVEHGVPVVTQSEITQLLGVERQRQLLGCSSDTSCMSEVADALGAQGMVMGSIGRLGDRYQLNVKVIRTRDMQTVALFSSSVDRADLVLNELTRGAAEMVDAIAEAFDLKLAQKQFQVWPAVLPVGLGVAAIGAGVGLFVSANTLDQQLRNAMPGTSNDFDYASAKAQANDINTRQIVATTCVAVGGAALIGGLALGLITNLKAPGKVALLPTGNGAVVVGTFP